MKNKVVVLDFWVSPFGKRVKIALEEKGIKYECKEKKLPEKSPLLLQSNPIHKLIPVLIHNGKSIFIHGCGKRVWMKKGEEQEAAKEEFIESLKLLEGELGEKPYFGRETMGLVDVTLVPHYSWFYTYEKCANFNIEALCPKLVGWAKMCLEVDTVAKNLPDQHNVYDFVLEVKKKWGIE